MRLLLKVAKGNSYRKRCKIARVNKRKYAVGWNDGSSWRIMEMPQHNMEHQIRVVSLIEQRGKNLMEQ
ncbi:unnamed protein product, partial [Allacma fusca]